MPEFYNSQVIKVINVISKKNKFPFLIGIDGCGGSGKTTFAGELARKLPNSSIIHMDDFYKPRSFRETLLNENETGAWFDWQRLREQVLELFNKKKNISYQKYDWDNDIMGEWVTLPADVNIIIEGIYSTRRELMAYYDYRVWIDCPSEVRLKRGVERDGQEMKEYWENVWMKQEEDYIKIQQPRQKADLIVNGSNY